MPLRETTLVLQPGRWVNWSPRHLESPTIKISLGIGITMAGTGPENEDERQITAITRQHTQHFNISENKTQLYTFDNIFFPTL